MKEIRFEDVEWLAVSILMVPTLIVILLIAVSLAGEPLFESNNPSREAPFLLIAAVWLICHVVAGVGIFLKRKAVLSIVYLILGVNLLGFPVLTALSIWGFTVLAKARRDGYFTS